VPLQSKGDQHLAREICEISPNICNPECEIVKVFDRDKFPNVAVTNQGTVLIVKGLSAVQAYRSEDGGETWSEGIFIAEGIHSGGLTVDEITGDILVFIEDYHPPAPLKTYASRDDGKSWFEYETTVFPDSAGRVPSMHMNERGITLQVGEHKGRLLRASHWYGQGDDLMEYPLHFTNAVYSDDHGLTWKTSEPFPALGTGEAAIVELKDGTLYCNSCRHWIPCGTTSCRWSAQSMDGGFTWTDLKQVIGLSDGPQDNSFGLFSGMAKLPLQHHDVLIFSNCDCKGERANGTIWTSFDGGKSWPGKRLLCQGPFGYSSVAAGKPGTASKGWIYCCFEGYQSDGFVARFNLAWLIGASDSWNDQ